MRSGIPRGTRSQHPPENADPSRPQSTGRLQHADAELSQDVIGAPPSLLRPKPGRAAVLRSKQALSELGTTPVRTEASQPT